MMKRLQTSLLTFFVIAVGFGLEAQEQNGAMEAWGNQKGIFDGLLVKPKPLGAALLLVKTSSRAEKLHYDKDIESLATHRKLRDTAIGAAFGAGLTTLGGAYFFKGLGEATFLKALKDMVTTPRGWKIIGTGALAMAPAAYVASAVDQKSNRGGSGYWNGMLSGTLVGALTASAAFVGLNYPFMKGKLVKGYIVTLPYAALFSGVVLFPTLAIDRLLG